MIFTENQQKAINIRNCNVLVSAAAGSGKTGVLTERILDRLRDGENIDELLVLTFTRAAASEMKSRIRDKINAAAENAVDEERSFWLKQMSLLSDAPITTIHAFCMRLLRRHYNLVPGLDPKFRVLTENRGDLIKDDTLSAYLEECYTESDVEKRQRFFDLLRVYGSNLNDDGLRTEILRLMNYGCSRGDLEEWLNDSVSRFGDFDFWYEEAMEFARKGLKTLIAETEADLALVGQMGTLESGGETLTEDLAHLREMQDFTWEQWGYAAPFGRKKNKKKDEDAALSDYIKNRRELRKTYFKERLQPLFYRSFKENAHDIAALQPLMETLSQMTAAFYGRYCQEKLKRGAVDFIDLEQYVLKLLTEHPEIADEYQGFFKEVLVDEYQDINPLQEKIISFLPADGRLFVVGDVKQSIYGFRFADSALFRRRSLDYGEGTANDKGCLIRLNENFRSRWEILAATNFIFCQLMNEDVSQLSYGEEDALHFGAAYYREKADAAVEMAVITRNIAEVGSNDYEKLACHGRFVAQRIEKMMEEGFTVQDKNGERPLAYGDITVLMRSGNKSGEVIGAELANRGIPVVTPSSLGYLSGRETKLIMAFLAVLDNPLQDIPLAAVMRSPLFSFDENELMALSLHRKKKKLWEAVQEVEAIENTVLDIQKAVAFRHQIMNWRNYARIYPVGELVEMFLREFDYISFWGGLSNGEMRMKNLRLFAEEAYAYQSEDGGGLFDFLRFMKHLSATGGDKLPNQEGDGDCVQVMNIHQSKGLEFPVVFLIQTEKKFNVQDLSGLLLLDGELGFGPKYKDMARHIITPTLPQQLIKIKSERAALAEEMRVLYVALTRAKEKLVITAIQDATSKLTAEENLAAKGEILQFDRETHLSAMIIAGDHSYYQWLLHACCRKENDSLPLPYREEALEIKTVAASAPLATVYGKKQRRLLPAADFERLEKTLTRREPLPLPAKVSVTSLLPKGSWEQDGVKLTRPKFFGERPRLTAAERGTAFHLFMEKLDFSKSWSEREILDYGANLVETGLLPRETFAAVDLEAVLSFLSSEYGTELQTATDIRKELSFAGSFPASRLFPDADEDERPVILQGAIDLIYRRANGGWVLMDYKTNDLSQYTTAAFLQKYGRQMQLYSESLQRVYDIEVTERVFYLTKMRSFICY